MKEVSHSGQGKKNLSTFNGNILFDYSNGEIAIRDDNYNKRTKLDILGLTTIRTDGSYAVRAGQARDNNRDGIWVVPVTEDLRDEGVG